MLQKFILFILGSSAIFFGFPNPFFHVPFFVLLYPVVLYHIGINVKKPFFLSFWTGIGCSPALYWIAVASHKYGGFDWYLALPCAFLLGAYIALWGACFSFLISGIKNYPSLQRCLSAGIFWYFSEWIRGFFMTGFPWLTISSGFAAWPIFLQPLSVLGEYAYSGYLVFITFLLYDAIALSISKKEFCCSVKNAFLSLLLITLAASYSVYRFRTLPSELIQKGKPLAVSIIQGNIPQDIKWTEMEQQRTVETYIRLTLDALKSSTKDLSEENLPNIENGLKNLSEYMGKITVSPKIRSTLLPELIIWPETAMPFIYGRNILGNELNMLAKKLQIPLFFGVLTSSATPQHHKKYNLYNSAVLLNGSGIPIQKYSKEHLVPFGEFLPFLLDLEIFHSLFQGLGGFSSGKNDSIPTLDINTEKIPLGVLICYEAIFPESAQKKVRDGAQFFINLSNDAWYEKTSAPIQHLHLSLMRSVEQCRYTARSTNTGITAIIDPLGGVYINGSEKLFKPDFLNGNLLVLKEHTLYYYLHPYLPFFVFLILLYLLRSTLRQMLTRKKHMPIS